MLDKTQALELVQTAIDSVRRSGIMHDEVRVTEDTILLGAGSPLDSMSFVSVITDLEDHLSQAQGTEVFLLFDEIHEFNSDESALTAGTLASYIAQLVAV